MIKYITIVSLSNVITYYYFIVKMNYGEKFILYFHDLK